jgi:prephenate dehydratase
MLPASGLHIIGEQFLPIRFQLMALPMPSAAEPSCTAVSASSKVAQGSGVQSG